MQELIEMLEKATEGSRALDDRIWEAINASIVPAVLPPTYTADVEVARTLVPQNWQNTVANETGLAYCWISNARWREGKAATPALALCIAALRARQARAGEPGKREDGDG